MSESTPPWEQPEALLAERVGTAQAGRIMAVARAQAAGDRELLARLVREGKVMQTGPRTAFTDAIEGRRRVNLAIRPKRKR